MSMPPPSPVWCGDVQIAIMQPYFFPYLGHFALMAHADAWIAFDVTQYTPKTWISRNRVLHPAQGWNYINVPLSNSSIGIKIHEARILDPLKAKSNLLGKLSHYQRKAPYYHDVIGIVEEVFSSLDSNSLVDLNFRGLEIIARTLNIPFQAKICSRMRLSLPERLGAGQWALEIARQVGARSYINPISGRGLFDPAEFSEHRMALSFLKFEEFTYDTRPYTFESNLSILDVLMWSHPDAVREALFANTRVIGC